MAALRVTYASRAVRDLDHIGDAIAHDAPRAAQRLIEKLQARALALADAPFASTPRDDLRPNLRVAHVRPYFIFFRVRVSDIRILRIVHGARRLPGLRYDE